jgi:signal transduction histidine kinase/ActR/RegA family two-component response regulator
MTVEFNMDINNELNSISALAVELTPVSVRLQKMVSMIGDILHIPATRLLLSDDLFLLPKLLVAGVDQKMCHLLEEERALVDPQFENSFSQAGIINTHEQLAPYCRTLTDRVGQTHVVVEVPIVVGKQVLGTIMLAPINPTHFIRENKTLLHALMERVGLVLLVLKNAGALPDKQCTMHSENRFSEEFLSVLSHELRAPLHAILGWVSVLQHPSTNPETWNYALKTIERSARTQSNIINDLLDASVCFNQQPELHKRPVPVRSILQQVIDLLLPAAEQKGIMFTSDVRVSGDCVFADGERLRQAFWHVLSNAIKFTPVKGQIQLLAQRTGDDFEMTLVDSGIGIAAEFMPYIFDPFRQESAQTTRKFGGLGLGLAIARHQIELHGGDIEIISAGRNQGVTVVVRLPLYMPLPEKNVTQSNAINPSASKPASFRKNLDGLRVLVVDDDTDSLEIVSTILQNCQSEVQTAVNAKDALDVLKRWEPDILISDIQMPGVDGYELIRQIRTDKITFRKRIAAIALTAYSRAEDRLKALASGFHTHLSKPVDPTELVAVVKSLGTQSRQTFSLT